MFRKTLVGVVLVTATTLTFVVGRVSAPDVPETVHCPTEDSCTVDYHNGQWHITPDRP
jgi:hypothetical protein